MVVFMIYKNTKYKIYRLVQLQTPIIEKISKSLTSIVA